MKQASKDEFPVDIVITWVDGGDPKWLAEKRKYSKKTEKATDHEQWADSDIRFRDWDNLRYVFRGIEQNCDWYNKIYFVTWGHLPKWLNTKNPRLVIVNHEDFIPEKYRPTFNSNAIELNFHRIKGLSENFVYFNDDMFPIGKTKKEDFFKNGKPTHSAILNVVMPDEITHPEYYNTVLLNKYFNKNEVLKKHFAKWFNLKYIPQIARTFFLLAWPKFTRLYETHLPIPHQKKYFEELWKLEPDVLDKTCSSRFRAEDNVSHWLMSDWYRVKGEFAPRTPNLGRHYRSDAVDKICNVIEKQKHKIMCIDDFGGETKEEFEQTKERFNAAFNKILPEKSSFEK